jgi:hypothetical protein
MFTDIAAASAQIKAGTLRPIVVTSKQRSALMPELPTIAETRVADYDLSGWIGCSRRPGRRADRRQAERGSHQGAQLPDVRTRSRPRRGAEPDAGAEYAQWVQQEVNKWTRLVEEAGIQPEYARRSKTMDFPFTTNSSMWHDTVHEFMEKEVGREYTREHDAAASFPGRSTGRWRRRVARPAAAGGGRRRRRRPVMFAIFCEAIAKFSLDTAACIMTSMFTATNISSHGTPAQKEKYLPPFLRGEATFSISISEPGRDPTPPARRPRRVLDRRRMGARTAARCSARARICPNATICSWRGPGRAATPA